MMSSTDSLGVVEDSVHPKGVGQQRSSKAFQAIALCTGVLYWNSMFSKGKCNATAYKDIVYNFYSNNMGKNHIWV